MIKCVAEKTPLKNMANEEKRNFPFLWSNAFGFRLVRSLHRSPSLVVLALVDSG